MTIPAQVSVYAQVFVPRDYDVFAGLDVDHHSIAATFTDHDRLMQSLRLSYSAAQLLNYYAEGPVSSNCIKELVEISEAAI